MTLREQARFVTTQLLMLRVAQKIAELPLDEFLAHLDRLQQTGEIRDGSLVGNAVALFPDSMREIATILLEARAALYVPLARTGEAGTLNLEALVE